MTRCCKMLSFIPTQRKNIFRPCIITRPELGIITEFLGRTLQLQELSAMNIFFERCMNNLFINPCLTRYISDIFWGKGCTSTIMCSFCYYRPFVRGIKFSRWEPKRLHFERHIISPVIFHIPFLLLKDISCDARLACVFCLFVQSMYNIFSLLFFKYYFIFSRNALMFYWFFLFYVILPTEKNINFAGYFRKL